MVLVEFRSQRDSWPRKDVTRELGELARSVNAVVIEQIFCVHDKPTSNLLIGKGKVEEIGLVCQEENIDTVIFSQDLSGTQQRNLDEIIKKKTIDRTQLILDIFSRHARSPEGKMQVELAQLQYLLPRLTGKGIALSRLGGGIGTRGPGEQKLEVDRRRIHKRISKLKQDLRHLTSHRKVLRKQRKDNMLPSLALVGYTNAGKSTLLNALTGAGQRVENSLFTTLDPLTRRMGLPSGGKAVVSDTVGFLYNLPHHLIDAFHATLEEVAEADLLICVLDASHPRVQEHSEAVSTVLKQLQCDEKPIIVVLNKTDLLDDKAWLNWLNERFPDSISISAKTGRNLEQLISRVEDFFHPQITEVLLSVPISRMDIVNSIYRHAKVKSTEFKAKTVRMKVSLTGTLLSSIL